MSHHKHDKEKKTREVDPKAQPDETFRRASSDDARSAEEHAFSTESHRFSDETEAQEVRGYPKEGGLPRKR